jgi:DNA polymerase-3 subunit delta'
VGQERAISQLLAAAARPVHAYLLVGPAGTGKRGCATGFAAALLCPHTASTGTPDGTCDVCRRVLARVHPDVVRVEREGAFISIDTAREVSRIAATSPVEGERKVVVLEDFHLVRDTGPALLKTIEEPPPATIFVILAEYIPPDLVTIASRCVQVELTPLSHDQVASALESLGAEREAADRVAAAAGGSLDRARLLVADEGFEARRRAWADVPTRLDGTGATAAAVADELVALLESSVGPLRSRQAVEASALAEHNRRAAEVVASGPSSGGRRGRGRAAAGVRRAPPGGSGTKELEEHHRREQRRQRTDELRYGLATLAGAYRDRMASAPDARRRAAAIEAIDQVDRTARSLEFNPGELLTLQALLARLGRISTQV